MKYCGPSCQFESHRLKIERWLSDGREGYIALTIRPEWEGIFLSPRPAGRQPSSPMLGLVSRSLLSSISGNDQASVWPFVYVLSVLCALRLGVYHDHVLYSILSKK